jgi:hypothetical protein
MANYWPTFWLFCGQLVDSKGRIENRNWPTFTSGGPAKALEDAKVWGLWHFVNVQGHFSEVA